MSGRTRWMLLGGLGLVGLAATFVMTTNAPGPQRSPRVFRTEDQTIRVSEVAGGLAHPWSLAFLPNGDMLVTERDGMLRVVKNGVLQPPVPGLPEIRVSGQGGLMEVALHPGFQQNRWVYLTYSKPGPRGSTTAVARGSFNGTAFTDLRDIFVADAWSSGGAHFGARIAFGRDGKLYLSVGERNDRRRAQDFSDHAGSILRLNDDGTAPSDNPFVGQAGIRPEIFTNGNRNPQGLAVHPETGALWENEQGPRGGDEINLILPGRNYGWPIVTFGREYSGAKITDETSRPGLESPLLYWVPSIACSGMAIYNGTRFPKWRGHVFVGALAGEHLRRVVFDGTRPVHQERLLAELGQRIRDVREGPDGLLYVLTDEDPGQILRIEPM